MDVFQESISAWASILETAYNVFRLARSGAWLTTFAILSSGICGIVSLYAARERENLEAAAIAIGGRSLDSLNLANLRRRVTSGIVIQEGCHTATIDGNDLRVVFEYSGYCAADYASAIQFSLDADSNTPYDELDCFGYDLVSDPDRKHKIRPALLGEDGISKKVALPLLDPVTSGQAFSVRLECTLPGCMKTGIDYYTSTLSFKQDRIRRLTVRLRFVGDSPAWVRAYKIDSNSQPQLLKDLRPVRSNRRFIEYVDLSSNIPGRSAIVYTFLRPTSARSAAAAR